MGYTFRKSRRQELLFAIELDGCAAAAAADRAAFRKNAKISVTVRVQEADLPPSDHAVSLSAHDRAYCLMPLQLVTKPKDRRTIARQQQAALDRQQRAIEEGGANPRSLDAAAAAEVLQWECPVQWVRVDPEGEWLAEVRVPVAQHGLEGMITAQLTKERPADVAAQAAAVAYLSKRAAAGSTSATRALLQCAGDETVFCRVRSDAAVALSSSARDGTQRANLAHTGVARAYRKRLCDPVSGLPLPSALGGASSLADAVVDEGFLRALGAPREPVREPVRGGPEASGKTHTETVTSETWHTPLECVELLIDALNHFRADGDPMDGSSFVAAALTSLGRTRPPRRRRTPARRRLSRGGCAATPPCAAWAAARTRAGAASPSPPYTRSSTCCARGGGRGVRFTRKRERAARRREGGRVPVGRGVARGARDLRGRRRRPVPRGAPRGRVPGVRARVALRGKRRPGARALALTALACKAEPSAGARADVLWDARDAFRARGGARAAATAWAEAAGSSPDGRALAHWTADSLRQAARLAGPEAGCAAAALLHALAGREGWHDALDAEACARRAADVEAALASAGGAGDASAAALAAGARGLAEAGALDDEAERAERRERKEKRRRAKAEKEERRRLRDKKRAARRAEHEAAMAAAAETAGPEPSGPETSGPEPSGVEVSEGALTGTGLEGSDGGLTGALSEGTAFANDSRATLTGGTGGGGGGGGDDEVVFAGAAAAAGPGPGPDADPDAAPSPAVAAVAAVAASPPPERPRSRHRVDRKTTTMTKLRRLRRHRPSLLRPRPRTRRRGWARSASGLRRRRLRPRRRRTPWRR